MIKKKYLFIRRKSIVDNMVILKDNNNSLTLPACIIKWACHNQLCFKVLISNVTQMPSWYLLLFFFFSAVKTKVWFDLISIPFVCMDIGYTRGKRHWQPKQENAFQSCFKCHWVEQIYRNNEACFKRKTAECTHLVHISSAFCISWSVLFGRISFISVQNISPL